MVHAPQVDLQQGPLGDQAGTQLQHNFVAWRALLQYHGPKA